MTDTDTRTDRRASWPALVAGPYLIRIDHVTYERAGALPGDPVPGWTLPAALAEVYGVRGAAILRQDGSPVVLHAGSSTAVVYVGHRSADQADGTPAAPRTVWRRLTWSARRRYAESLATR